MENIKGNEMLILAEFKKLHLSEDELFYQVRKYVLAPEQLFSLGFPEEFCNRVRILNKPFPLKPRHSQNYDKNKKPVNTFQHCPYNFLTMRVFEQNCARCGTEFFLTNTGYLTNERCYYHHGKLKYQWDESNQASIYTCCGQLSNSRGCSVGRLHVWSGLENEVNNNITGFVKTQPRMNEWIKPGIYALDCEMCYTIKGMELCKVTVVSIEGRLIYDSFVKPEFQVIDYNTRFSGVTAEHVMSQGRTLLQVQRDLLSFIYEDTILVGHSLNNDSRVLKILHKHFVDTSLLFPHERGYPYRYSLKYLALHCLRKKIQSSIHGHSSLEDAIICIELLLWKVIQDAKRKEGQQ